MPDKVSGSAAGRAASVPRRLLVVLVFTAAFMAVEAVAGWVSGALALLADAGHMLTDVGALALSLGSAVLARRPADPRRTFGFLRVEILAALVNGAALFGMAAWVVVEAVGRLGHPEPIRTGIFVAVATAGLVVNLGSLYVLHGAHGHSLNLRGAYLHVLGDALGSVGALAAALVVRYTGWTAADPIASILLSLLILFGAWRLLRESVDILLEVAPGHVDTGRVRAGMLAVPGVRAVHDLHIWSVTSGVVAMSGHAVVPDLGDHPAALEGLRRAVAGLGIAHATIQLEVEDACGGVDCMEVVAAEGHAGHRHGPGEVHPHPH